MHIVSLNKRKKNIPDKENEHHKTIFFFLDGMGDKQDKFDTSYSIKTVEDKE